MEVAMTKTSFVTIRLSAAPRALIIFDRGSRGSAAPHPRLYAIACFAGYRGVPDFKSAADSISRYMLARACS